MTEGQRTGDQVPETASDYPPDVTPEEIEAFRREDLLKLVLRNGRIFLMSGVVLIVFFAFPSLVYSDRYVFSGYRSISFVWAYCVFGPGLLIAGFALHRRWAWGRWLALVLAWVGMPVIVVLAGLLVRMIAEASRSLFAQSLERTWVPAAILGVMFAPLVIIGLLVMWKYQRFLRSEDVRALFDRGRESQ